MLVECVAYEVAKDALLMVRICETRKYGNALL